MTYLTEKEIHVLGVQRTGQHAVIAWIIGHFDNVCFRNGMSSVSDKRQRALQPPFWYFSPKNDDKGKWRVSQERIIEEGQDAIVLGTEFLRPRLGLSVRFEQQRLDMAKKTGYDEFSKDRKHVLVIRSPYNHYASILSWHRNRLLKNPRTFRACWKMFAREYVGITNQIEGDKVFVPYDRWFRNKRHRKKISKELGVPFCDDWINVVLRIGIGKKFGSSFDKMKHRKQAQKMNVLNRYKKYVDDPAFRAVFDDDELRELSENIFGDFPF